MFILMAGGLRETAADPSVYEPAADPLVGFNLISWWNFYDDGPAIWEDAVQSIYDAGFREVSISPVRYVNFHTGEMLSSSYKGPELSHIEAGVAKAESLGMRVTLNPFVELMDTNGESDPINYEYYADLPNGCQWRGCYNPRDFDNPGGMVTNAFWHDYRDYLLEVAAIAETHGVDAMTVGTEYSALNYDEGQNSFWNQVINDVDGVYHGRLGYAADWSAYNYYNVANSIWNHPAIDFLGIDSYFEFLIDPNAADASGTYPDPAFIDLLTAAWNNKLDNEILPFAASLKGGTGLPVVFTEQGFLPYNLTSVDPQNHYYGSQPVDTDEQIMAFQSLLNALDGRQDVFAALHIWNWAMPGSDGTLWNIDPTLPADQPNNVPLAQWLSRYVRNVPEPSALSLAFVGLVVCGWIGSRRRASALCPTP
jgi:sugar phosphate isomerase/epimerase